MRQTAVTDTVRHQLLSLSSARESPAILAARILVTGAQADRLILSVWLMAPSEVPSIQVMQSPHLVAARLLPGKVVLP